MNEWEKAPASICYAAPMNRDDIMFQANPFHVNHSQIATVSRHTGVRPYLLAVLLFIGAAGLMYLGEAHFLTSGFPWALVSLLVVAAAASLWGTRPALVVLILSALFVELIVPDLHLAYLNSPPLSWHALVFRMLLFVACGAATIWLTYQARRMQEQAERRRSVVETLQRMISPDRLAAVPGYDVSGVYRPARFEEEVGGDFYDLYPIAPGVYGLLIGDVMGKGKEAAEYTAVLRYTVRAYTGLAQSPAQSLALLNDLIEAQQFQFGTASLFLGILDARSGRLRYASAGHEPPLLRRTDGTEEALITTGPIIGVGSGFAYGEQTLILEPGDSLLLMTDGVTEARNDRGQFLESVGAWRFLHRALDAPTAETALSSMERSVAEHIGRNSRDDIALLLLRREQTAEMDGAVTLTAAQEPPCAIIGA